MDGKHIIGVDQDDVEAIGVKGVDTGSTLAGYGWNVVKVLFECERFPPECMLDCFGVNASGMETYAGTHLKRVRRPLGEGIDVGDGIDALGGVAKGSSDMFGADEGDGAGRKAGGGKDCEGVRGGKV